MGMFLSVQEPLSAPTCCDILASIPQLDGRVHFPSDGEYNARMQSFFSINAAQEPWCIVMPQSLDDVSKIAGVISQNECPFGIRSGGHATWNGSNSVRDGVTVDLGAMTAVRYDRANKIVSIEPGATAEQVYKFLDEFDVTIAGPRNAEVSLGGFITGGGYSFYAHAYGFSCDTVTNFQVVLASGETVNANKDSHPDLWKALKGGSGNFGFVTRIDMQVMPTNEMHTQYITYDSSNSDSIFKAYTNFVDRMHEGTESLVNIGIRTHKGVLKLHAEITSPKRIKMQPDFSDFMLVKSETHRMTPGTMTKIVERITAKEKQTSQHTTWTTSMLSCKLRTLQIIYEKLSEYYDKMKLVAPTDSFGAFIQINPVTKSMMAHSRANGGNALGLEDVVADGPVVLLLIAFGVDTAETQRKIGPIFLAFRDAMDELAAQHGLKKNWKYLNYATGDQTPIQNYGDKSLSFLKATARKYDPTEVFQDLRLSGFKIKDSTAVKWEEL